ncbi:PmoA family protein [Balneolales bacterium ANBcel1]|nr:PmoA family protein [Balneolales bacterium ANBcel1]
MKRFFINGFGCFFPTLILVLLLMPSGHLYARTSASGTDGGSDAVILAEISVAAGEATYYNTPVTAVLEGVSLKLADGRLQLIEVTGGEPVPVASQLFPGTPDRLAWILEGETGPAEERVFQLWSVSADRPEHGREHPATVEDDGENLIVSIGGKPVLSYRHAHMGTPDGVDEIFGRSGYIHPVWSPGGQVLSRIQPPDHYHHYGIWNPWTSTEFRGRGVDFWNLGQGQGAVTSRQVPERLNGAVAAGFRALHDHIVFEESGRETVALSEQWVVTAWKADSENEWWLVDFVSILNPATEDPLTIREYRYQGFSLRATEAWHDDNTTLLTSGGYDKSNANATRARWIDVNGATEADQGTSGILFMTHPGNFNYPEQLRIWPVGANQGEENVFINFNPAQDRDWVLEPGNSYSLRYRMLIYDGSIDEATADRHWRSFAHPPEVRVRTASADE